MFTAESPSESLNFRHNWNNKLNNHFFTTLRKIQSQIIPDCYKVGKVYNLRLKGEYFGRVHIVQSKAIKFSQLNDWIVCTDTGLPPEEGRAVLRNLARAKPDEDFYFCFMLLAR